MPRARHRGLITSASGAGAYNQANLILQQLPGGTRKVVQRGAYHGRYLPSGYLAYFHDGTLFAAPFDLDRQEVTGPPVPAIEGLGSNSITGGAQLAVSASGTAQYLPGSTVGAGTPLHWMGAEGKTTPFPDGEAIAFASNRADNATMNLYWQRTDGTASSERLTVSTNHQYPMSWHPSGRHLLFVEESRPLNVDVMVLLLLYGLDGRIMVAPFTIDAGMFRHEAPRPWSAGRHQTPGSRRMFDLHPDAERVALASTPSVPGRSNPDAVVFVFNFFDELRRITTSPPRWQGAGPTVGPPLAHVSGLATVRRGTTVDGSGPDGGRRLAVWSD